MTDITAERLAQRIQDAIAEAAVEIDEAGPAVLGHDLHVANNDVNDLLRRLLEADSQTTYWAGRCKESEEQRDTALAALAKLGEFIAKTADELRERP